MFKKSYDTFLLNLNDHVQRVNAEDEVNRQSEIYQQRYSLTEREKDIDAQLIKAYL